MIFKWWKESDEALTSFLWSVCLANMKQSVPTGIHTPKVCFIAAGCFIFHVPQARFIPKRKKSHLCVTFLFGDPDETRTRVTAVKGRCLNRLTTGPYIWKRRTRYPALFIVDLVAAVGLEPTTLRVWTECSSQLSYAAICHAAFTTLEYNITTFYICQAFFESFFIFFLLFFISLFCLCFR